MKFVTVVADPPWEYDKNVPWSGGSLESRISKMTPEYNRLSLEQICRLPVQQFMAADSFLWLWVPSQQMRKGWHLRVAESWGFEIRAERIWHKKSGGTGFWFCYNHEYLFLGVRGTPGNLYRNDRGLMSVLNTPITTHSRKPEAFYRDIEDVCPGPYLELFAREVRPMQLDLIRERSDWTVWGDQVGDPLGIGFDPESWG